jgi:antitoxin VapB
MPIVIATVCTSKKSQLIEIPDKARLPSDLKKVCVRTRGQERIISPIEKTWDSFFLNGLLVTDDFMDQW